MPPFVIGTLGGGTDIAHDNPWEGILAIPFIHKYTRGTSNLSRQERHAENRDTQEYRISPPLTTVLTGTLNISH